ncbi:MAG: toxin-antitoxin system YwqK family antitoxin [Alphaproteobacteria bacterium]|nr:toxin-antitoxin system YwqK family antitoxin [Alphaproteobacteria bacterium]
MPSKYTALFLVLLSTTVSAEETTKRYLVPDDVICEVKAPQNTMFCTDTDGKPITGQMVKYFEGTPVRLYNVKEGQLDGPGQSYYTDGTLKSEIPYLQGQINGVMKKYNRLGKISEEIPYQNNQKEGVAKYYNDEGALITQMVYINDEAIGDMFIYDGTHETPLYRLKNHSGTILSGTYTYQTAADNLKTETIPEIIIAALNKKCLDFQPQLSSSPCAAFYNQNPECDQAWREENRKAVRAYLKSCSKNGQ